MKRLHVLVRDKSALETIRPLQDGTGRFRNGEWELSEQTADDLVADGQIMIHPSQKGPCRHGGRVVDYTTQVGVRVDEKTGEERECTFYTLIYEPMDELQGVVYKGNWSYQIAIEVVP